MPRLSVVIASWNGQRRLERCLGSFVQDAGMETVVAANFPVGDWEGSGPFRIIAMPAGTTVPALRTAGIAAARGEIVVLIEDHCTAARGWLPAIEQAHSQGWDAVGGPVENGATGNALDWAVYFYDYGKYMLPCTAGSVEALSGMNMSFKKAVLRQVEASFRDGFFEPFTQGEVRQRGYALYMAPGAVVYHRKTYRLGSVAAHCYHLGRGYAAKRVEGLSGSRRALMAAASFALPALLPGRIAVNTFRKKRLRGELVRCFPYLFLLTACWSFGEFCGYAAGEGGSAGQWK